ncbi:hypothetical protein Pfo_021379 [Paulownia fortunei]|nr:hypothetical protein Pfo_021379 [Paulownia fortunei]
MANFHSRSNSFPSQSHPVMECVEDHLCRLKASEATSTSATSICANLASLRDLHEGINNLIQMPSIQQALSHEQDIVYLTKESVQDLESSIRRNKVETTTAVDINAYVASRKKINKMVNKCIKNLKSFNQNSTAFPDRDYDLKSIGTMLKEAESLDFSVLKSALILLSGEKERSNQRSWSLLSKFTKTSRVYSENMLKQLKASEMTIQEIEEGLEALFRSLVKTRVSLLNVLSH